MQCTMLHGLNFLTASYCIILSSKIGLHFLGFAKENNILYAVLKQPFIISDAQVDLEDIKKLLVFTFSKRSLFGSSKISQV